MYLYIDDLCKENRFQNAARLIYVFISWAAQISRFCASLLHVYLLYADDSFMFLNQIGVTHKLFSA